MAKIIEIVALYELLTFQCPAIALEIEMCTKIVLLPGSYNLEENRAHFCCSSGPKMNLAGFNTQTSLLEESRIIKRCSEIYQWFTVDGCLGLWLSVMLPVILHSVTIE